MERKGEYRNIRKRKIVFICKTKASVVTQRQDTGARPTVSVPPVDRAACSRGRSVFWGLSRPHALTLCERRYFYSLISFVKLDYFLIRGKFLIVSFRCFRMLGFISCCRFHGYSSQRRLLWIVKIFHITYVTVHRTVTSCGCLSAVRVCVCVSTLDPHSVVNRVHSAATKLLGYVRDLRFSRR